MSFRLPVADVIDEDGLSQSSSDEDDDDQTWDDWVSDSARQPCRSLFEEKSFPSVEEALKYDNVTYGFDLNGTCAKLSLDTHGRIRLINYIRKQKISSAEVAVLTGTESFFESDEYLIPAVEDDPLLQLQADDWSDSDDEGTSDPSRRILALEKKLARTQQEFHEYRTLISKEMDLASLVEPSTSEPHSRDDDTHYFESYGANDIHAVMIQDQVRTSTYAQFILTNPSIFEDAVVLDVGCGTGILSLFAARGGAKHVYAVDASDIAEKAEKIVKVNGMEDIITVIRGKIEDLTIPEKVDIIISEWMGYALLYESMLDSVLSARDRFLRPGGIMAPSQCKMMLGLCDASEVLKDRVTFWNDVYGFDLSAMADDMYDEAIIDVVGPNTMMSTPYTVKDLYLGTISPRQLNFSSTFLLVSRAERRTKVTAFVLYFDTFFTKTGKPVSPSTQVKVVKDDEVVLAEVWPVGGKPPPQRRPSQGADREKVTSFSTGPQSIPTHWKQTIFLLREPIVVEEGSKVRGTFYCRKSGSNSRELEIEIHYVKQDSTGTDESKDLVVQMYTVR
ncbi:S-adenosyl-L-methionine-dependent methyltransferase [Guyanagaster necrorhizus]|uniref:type I protein arginine methyltransferase n=1 Tax=Guyanagaster necrorhizus TaxID=856835 RepID=A0A9P7VP24_9AGAR|nr:S-adenosyl-L-methionine-dependent methyltransferase [Guyanagaster necrorhizus MCA 3950]KAG7444182.1 S-adenosyl-L-methionine-dependent methyltransferase [Guyanagaster necrorhizus MCA 3950]